MAIDWKLNPANRRLIHKLFTNDGVAARAGGYLQHLGWDASAPETNVDIALANGDLVIVPDATDELNSDVFVASAVTATTTTWTKIVD